MLRVNPPIRSEEDRRALIGGLGSGAVDFLVTDHAPHLVSEKLSPSHPSGVPGLDNYGNVVAWLMKESGIDARRLALATSGNQSRFYGLGDRGELAKGKLGDLAVVDPKLRETVTADTLMTKCVWSPYVGIEFSGRVRWTVKRGDIIVNDCQISR